jgi:predicted MPP superfamily phosphohydrolase
MPLHLQIVSDLHIEFWDLKNTASFIKPSAPILCLLGDIGRVAHEAEYTTYKAFITALIPHYEKIFIVAGNHEYYFGGKKSELSPAATIDACNEKIRVFCKTSPKLQFLQNSSCSVTLKDQKYIIAGATLWSNILPQYAASVQKIMNDYQHIYTSDVKNKFRLITPADIYALHLKAVKYIKSQVTKAKKEKAKLIVLTHHKPYLSPTHDPLKYDIAYESDLTCMFGKPLVLWGYGHTHIKDNSTVKGTKVFSNPKGYPNQQTKFVKNEVISV